MIMTALSFHLKQQREGAYKQKEFSVTRDSLMGPDWWPKTEGRGAHEQDFMVSLLGN